MVAMLAAVVCSTAVWLLCKPTGRRPNTVVRQKLMTPRERVISTNENAVWGEPNLICVFLIFITRGWIPLFEGADCSVSGNGSQSPGFSVKDISVSRLAIYAQQVKKGWVHKLAKRI